MSLALQPPKLAELICVKQLKSDGRESVSMKHNMGSSGKVTAHRAVVPASAVLAALRSRVCQLTAFADTCTQSNPALCTAGFVVKYLLVSGVLTLPFSGMWP